MLGIVCYHLGDTSVVPKSTTTLSSSGLKASIHYVTSLGIDEFLRLIGFFKIFTFH